MAGRIRVPTLAAGDAILRVACPAEGHASALACVSEGGLPSEARDCEDRPTFALCATVGILRLHSSRVLKK